MSGAHVLNHAAEDFKLGQEMLSKQRKMEERGAKEHQPIYKFVMNINAQVCNTLSSLISNSALDIILYTINVLIPTTYKLYIGVDSQLPLGILSALE